MLKVGQSVWLAKVQGYSVVIDAEREHFGTEHKVELTQIEVLSITPKGAWVGDSCEFLGSKSFMRTDRDPLWWKYQPTKTMALTVLARKQRYKAEQLEKRKKLALRMAQEADLMAGNSSGVEGLL